MVIKVQCFLWCLHSCLIYGRKSAVFFVVLALLSNLCNKSAVFFVVLALLSNLCNKSAVFFVVLALLSNLWL